MILPSIDLMDGKAVQLQQGKTKILEREDVMALAEEFSRYGDLAVIDLDAARSINGDGSERKDSNRELVKTLCRRYPCRVGGGIRTRADAQELLAAGARKLIIGTAAEPGLLCTLPRERIIVALDALQGKVTSNGWQRIIEESVSARAQRLEQYCSGFLYTCIEREGMLQGPDLQTARMLARQTINRITVAGGISMVVDVRAIADADMDCQLGMAIYTGALSLADAFISALRFPQAKDEPSATNAQSRTPLSVTTAAPPADESSSGLLPTIVWDGTQPLMLGYSSKDSLRASFRSGLATFYSRSRKELWEKGKTSGNTLRLRRVDFDCDRDALLFTVDPQGPTCHTGGWSCFDERAFSIAQLEEVIKERIASAPPGSRTAAWSMQDLQDKIREEADEVACFTNRENLIWEAADVTYFLTVLLARQGVGWNEVLNELARRRR